MMSQLLAEPEIEKLMTSEEFEALPDDGVERWLIRGKLYENQDADMTLRNRFHCETTTPIASALYVWLQLQPEPRGKISTADVGFRLPTNPASTLGADIAYISHTVAATGSPNTTLYDGSPILAIEILSPYDKVRDIQDKIAEYLAGGTQLVWIVNPYDQTIAIHRFNTPVVTLNNTQKLENLPELLNFSVDVADLFQ